MRTLIITFLLVPVLSWSQQITYPVINNGDGTFELEKVNDVNNTAPVPVLDYETVDSTFLRNYFFSELISSQDEIAINSYNGIIRNQQSKKIFQGINNNLGISNSQVLDSLQTRHIGRLDGNWRYNVIGAGAANIFISNDTMYLASNSNVWATFQNWSSKRIEVFISHNSIGPDTLFLNTPTGALWAGQTKDEGFHSMRHRPIDEN